MILFFWKDTQLIYWLLEVIFNYYIRKMLVSFYVAFKHVLPLSPFTLTPKGALLRTLESMIFNVTQVHPGYTCFCGEDLPLYTCI